MSSVQAMPERTQVQVSLHAGPPTQSAPPVQGEAALQATGPPASGVPLSGVLLSVVPVSAVDESTKPLVSGMLLSPVAESPTEVSALPESVPPSKQARAVQALGPAHVHWHQLQPS